jgi:type II secretory pathway component GspD/PulD (secretin)
VILVFLYGCQTKKQNIKHFIKNDQYEKYSEYIEKKEVSNLSKKPSRKRLPEIFYRKISISISNEMDAREIIFEIAKQSKINLILDSKINISKGLSYNCENKSIIQVIDDLCEILNLKYSIRGDTVFIKSDEPCFKTFSVSFLFATRNSKGDSSISTDMGHENDNGTSMSNESKFFLQSKTEINFWEELRDNILFILKDLSISKDVSPDKICVIHKQAGLISVYGTRKHHKQIRDYIKKLKRFVYTQITIEIKIIQIDLNKESTNGVDWNMVRKSVKFPLKISLPFANGGTLLDNSDMLKPQAEFGTENTSSIIKALEIFGSVQVTSNPRITVLNNQPAFLKVAKNEVFFKIDVKNTVGKGSAVLSTVSSTIKTIPIGLLMKVQACSDYCEDTADYMINLAISAFISRVVGFKNDPGVSLEAAKYNSNLVSSVPVVQHQEVDTWVRVKNDSTIIIGGLIETTDSSQAKGLPGTTTSKVSSLFGQNSKEFKKKELVLIIHTKVNNPLNSDSIDKDDDFCFLNNLEIEDEN